MKNIAIAIFTGIAAAQRSRGEPDQLPSNRGETRMPPPSFAPQDLKRRGEMDNKRPRGMRGPGMPHNPPRGIDNFDQQDFEKMQERMTMDLQMKAEKKQQTLNYMCDLFPEEEQANCYSWASAEATSMNLLGTCSIEFDASIALCNNSVKKNAASYLPKKNNNNEVDSADEEEFDDIDTIYLLESADPTMVESMTNTEIGQCFTDSLDSLKGCMEEAVADLEETTFTNPDKQLLKDAKDQLRAEKMQKEMQKMKYQRWGDQGGFGGFGKLDRDDGRDAGNYRGQNDFSDKRDYYGGDNFRGQDDFRDKRDYYGGDNFRGQDDFRDARSSYDQDRYNNVGAPQDFNFSDKGRGYGHN